MQTTQTTQRCQSTHSRTNTQNVQSVLLHLPRSHTKTNGVLWYHARKPRQRQPLPQKLTPQPSRRLRLRLRPLSHGTIWTHTQKQDEQSQLTHHRPVQYEHQLRLSTHENQEHDSRTAITGQQVPRRRVTFGLDWRNRPLSWKWKHCVQKILSQETSQKRVGHRDHTHRKNDLTIKLADKN